MKRILLIFILTISLQNCGKIEFKNGGNFIADNNDYFYALSINTQMDSIKIYALKEHSSSDSENVIAERKNYEFYLDGLISVKENEIEIIELRSDLLPSKRPKLKNLKIDNDKIYVDCHNLTDYLIGKRPNANWNCNTKIIEFSRMKN